MPSEFILQIGGDFTDGKVFWTFKPQGQKSLPSDAVGFDIGVRWSRLWTQVFPLHVFVERDEIEFFVVNSVAPDPGALASAFGRLTGEQIGRLERGLIATRAKVAVILMRHPICGWEDEPKDRHRRFDVDINGGDCWHTM